MESVDVGGIETLQEKLKAISPQSPEMRKKLRDAIRKALAQVRNELSKDARSGLKMDSDPRNAYKAVRHAVYKKILGGQVNILQKRKAGATRLYLPPRKNGTGRGGNRWSRSERTNQVDSYQGADRGFILRFLNQGAGPPREAHSYTDRNGTRHTLSRNANRGTIASRDWFGRASQQKLEQMAGKLDTIIDDIINEIF